MQKELGQNNPDIATYFDQLLTPEDSVLKKVREMTVKNGMPEIQVAKYDARHLEVLVRSMNAKKAVEIGTLAGYSGISIVRGLLPGGMLYTFDVSSKHLEIAKQSFDLAGVGSQVKMYLGEALIRLPEIEDNGPFDLVFIDADKANYVNYFYWAKKNLKVGGTILADNTFAWGNVHDPANSDKMVAALREYNQVAASDRGFRTTIIPTCEGLTMSVKIAG